MMDPMTRCHASFARVLVVVVAAATGDLNAQSHRVVSSTSPVSYQLPAGCAASRVNVRVESIDIPMFSPALGRLSFVTVSHQTQTVSPSVDLRCQGGCPMILGAPVPVTGLATLDTTHTLSIPGAGGLAANDIYSAPFTYFQRTVLPLAGVPAQSLITIIGPGPEVDQYVGTGTVSMSLTRRLRQTVVASHPTCSTFTLPLTQTSVSVTYHYETPWQDERNGLAGTAGTPQLAGSGGFGGGTRSTLALTNANPNAPAVLLLGSTKANLMLFGGVIVPTPMAHVPIVVDPTGSFSFSFAAPFAPGVTLYFQYWIADPGGPAGLAASNALSARS